MILFTDDTPPFDGASSGKRIYHTDTLVSKQKQWDEGLQGRLIPSTTHRGQKPMSAKIWAQFWINIKKPLFDLAKEAKSFFKNSTGADCQYLSRQLATTRQSGATRWKTSRYDVASVERRRGTNQNLTANRKIQVNRAGISKNKTEKKAKGRVRQNVTKIFIEIAKQAERGRSQSDWKTEAGRICAINAANLTDTFEDNSEQKKILKAVIRESNRQLKKRHRQNRKRRVKAGLKWRFGNSNAERSEIVSKRADPQRKPTVRVMQCQKTKGKQSRTRATANLQTGNPHTGNAVSQNRGDCEFGGRRGEQTIELAWRDQMNEKPETSGIISSKDSTEAMNANDFLIRKRDVLENSGLNPTTRISAIYTLEDMELIRVRRLSGNKENSVYILTEEEGESYRKAES